MSGKNIDDYDFDEELEPFSPHIADDPYPTCFRMPTMPTYNGTTNPSNHLGSLNTLMMAHNVNVYLRCILFPVRLTGPLKLWFNKYKNHSITSWKKLSSKFKRQFRAAKGIRVEANSLANIKQHLGESPKAYLNQFTNVVARSTDARDCSKLMAMRMVITVGGDLRKECQRKGVKSVDEFLARAQEWINQPALIQPTGVVTEVVAVAEPATQNNQSGGNKQKRNNTRERIFLGNSTRLPWKKLEPLRHQRVKLFRYHNDIGHNTDDFCILNDEIKTLIRARPLAQYAQNRRFSFDASNNEAEYEEFLVGVRVAKEVKAKCVLLEEAQTILQEIHEGFCGDHAGWQNIALKYSEGCFLANEDPKDGVLGMNLEALYQIVEILHVGTFKLARLGGELVPQT
ncbi:uncharacterized protein LOC133785121 [Humulus lupulus]|uniref:uncharacterized protein LOC133785121 n=1 Tax=Humulus lupulus TaxID=3486 RepID=UPI002B41063B|nr:uncharacterized protein LOC133785121 [Humulus lupulus]